MPILEVRDFKKSFGETEVLKGISFSMEKGETLPSSAPRAAARPPFCGV